MEDIREVRVRLQPGINIGYGSYVEIDGKRLKCLGIRMDQRAHSVGVLTLEIPMSSVRISMLDEYDEVVTVDIGELERFEW